MRSASGQATVEYIGVLVVVAVLVGAVAGGFGLPALSARIASSIARAVLGTLGVSEPAHGEARVRPSAADRAAFARAVDPAVVPDERPSLGDVRLDLIEKHGDDQGRAVYRELVLEDLRAVVPGLGGATLFATATAGIRPRGIPERSLPIDGGRSLARPVGADRGEVEMPIGPPDAHVVTRSEADRAFDHALHPGTSYTGIGLDVLSMLPGIGPASGAARGFVRLARVAARFTRAGRAARKGVSAITNAATLERDARALAPDASASPPGSREGDEIVNWLAARCPANGGAVREFRRTAVVRDGAVILEGIRWPDEAPVWHPGSIPVPSTEEGCS